MRIFLVVLLTLVPFLCFGEVTSVYYLNGIGSSKDTVKTARNLIKYRNTSGSNPISEIYSDEFQFKYIYNDSKGLKKDIVEVINQKNFETGGLTVDELLSLIELLDYPYKSAIFNSLVWHGRGTQRYIAQTCNHTSQIIATIKAILKFSQVSGHMFRINMPISSCQS